LEWQANSVSVYGPARRDARPTKSGVTNVVVFVLWSRHLVEGRRFPRGSVRIDRGWEIDWLRCE